MLSLKQRKNQYTDYSFILNFTVLFFKDFLLHLFSISFFLSFRTSFELKFELDWGYSLEVVCLPTMHKALGSMPHTAK
jgi:hypothetical protein